MPKADSGRAHPYICPAGYWKISYGHLCDPGHPPITEAEAKVYLTRDLQTPNRAPALANENLEQFLTDW